jgi:hypothetical protein
MSPRIALISATPAAIDPAVTALAEEFPNAEPWNILDDRLLADAKGNGLTPALTDRMRRLIAHAVTGGADGVLLTCSLYGNIAKETEAPIPVLAPDAAAFDEAMSYRRILVVASLEAALHDSVARFRAAAPGVEVAGALIDECQDHVESVDAVLLAQFSLAPGATKLSKALGLPVISGPRSAATRLKSVIEG